MAIQDLSNRTTISDVQPETRPVRSYPITLLRRINIPHAGEFVQYAVRLVDFDFKYHSRFHGRIQEPLEDCSWARCMRFWSTGSLPEFRWSHWVAAALSLSIQEPTKRRYIHDRES